MIVVAGVVTVRVARQFESFPIPFVSSTTHPGDISIRLAGVGWTVARTLQQLGDAVRLATYVGTDLAGRLAKLELHEHGLAGPTVLSTDSQPRSMVLYDREGRRCGASDLRRTPRLTYPATLFAQTVPGDCTAAVLTNIGFTRSLIPVVAERGIPFATDLHLVRDVESAHNQDWMRCAHVLASSHEKLPMSPEQWVRRLWSRYGTEVVIVGCGSRGALLGLRAQRRIWHVPAVAPRGVRFQAGAGDTLLATFVHGYFRSGDPVAAIRRAVLAAGWKVGGTPDEEAGVPAVVLERLIAEGGLPGVIPVE
ncbi:MULTISPECIES: carbohydrate kinase family protein [Amycolatopsis]|uniref:carbohydrate kinase family protein n=1 Tax=Amycolatopsis TaxID=1813 RepID=UPI0013041285|nr:MULTISPECIES: carbohydrate kinase family protein [Amycolatopsis]